MSQVFPKPLHEMTTEELTAEIEKVRESRRRYIVESRKKPRGGPRETDSMAEFLRGLTPEQRAKLAERAKK